MTNIIWLENILSIYIYTHKSTKNNGDLIKFLKRNFQENKPGTFISNFKFHFSQKR